MATIESANLGIGRTGRRRSEYFDLNGTISWSDDEIRANRPFLLRGYLVERDGTLDSYSVRADGGLNRRQRGVSDDIIGEIWEQIEMRPGEGTNFRFERRARDLTRSDYHEHTGEFRAVVTIVPTELTGSFGISNEVRFSHR